jgi:PPOX class probable F420-dependent enzyme
MDERQQRERVAAARVARVGTLDEQGRAHLVPIVFVLDGDHLYSATDAGPRPAKRLRNLARDPRVTVLVDGYSEDWSQVWWVRLRGRGRTVGDGPERDRALRLLWDKYPQYGGAPPAEAAGPVMAVDVEEWSGWAYAG